MKKVLVVEDNATNMYLVCYILRGQGFEVLEAETGEEGVRLALDEKPDLVLMDIQLPGISGLDAVRQIRKTDRAEALPIVALTAHAMPGDRESALAAGCTGYIEKPIDAERFIDVLRRLLPD